MDIIDVSIFKHIFDQLAIKLAMILLVPTFLSFLCGVILNKCKVPKVFTVYVVSGVFLYTAYEMCKKVL
ncbi:hypothetical protein [Bacillus manliponensis]|uniref:hypothetical protein n=1 Tax=Bacillus manliponensis TaxID=574376 RepID=UPI003516B8AA